MVLTVFMVEGERRGGAVQTDGVQSCGAESGSLRLILLSGGDVTKGGAKTRPSGRGGVWRGAGEKEGIGKVPQG